MDHSSSAKNLKKNKFETLSMRKMLGAPPDFEDTEVMKDTLFVLIDQHTQKCYDNEEKYKFLKKIKNIEVSFYEKQKTLKLANQDHNFVDDEMA